MPRHPAGWAVAGDRPGVRGCLAAVILVLLVFSGLAHALGTGQHAGPPAEDHSVGLHAADSVCCADTADAPQSKSEHAECGSGGGCPLCVPAGLVTAPGHVKPTMPVEAITVARALSPVETLYRPPIAPVPS